MIATDGVRYAWRSIASQRTRSLLTLAGIAVGIAAVILLTSIGEGLNRYVVEQFTQFGTTTIQLQPGKSTTFGMSPGALNSVRPLSLADAEALKKQLEDAGAKVELK